MKLPQKIFNKLPNQLIKYFYDDNLLFPFYHTVSDSNLPHINNLFHYRSVKEFRNDMEYFLQNHLPIDLGELISIVRNNKKKKEKSFFLSFDDGLSEIYTVIAPILKELGIPAAFYICPDFLDNKNLFFRHKVSLLAEQFNILERVQIEKISSLFLQYDLVLNEYKTSMLAIPQSKSALVNEIADVIEFSFSDFLKEKTPYLTSYQVLSLQKDGFSIGAHSMNHPLYSTLTLSEQLMQTKESLNVISNKFKCDYNTFAFPFNDVGVSKSFFQELYSMQNFDLSFGTAGFLTETVKYNTQRFSMESTSGSAEQILKYHAYKKMRSIIKKQNLIIREQ